MGEADGGRYDMMVSGLSIVSHREEALAPIGEPATWAVGRAWARVRVVAGERGGGGVLIWMGQK